MAQACADNFVANHLFYSEFYKEHVHRTSARYIGITVPAYAISFKNIFDEKSPIYRKLDMQEDAFLVFALLPNITEEGPSLSLVMETDCHPIGEGYPCADLGESGIHSTDLTDDFKLDSTDIEELTKVFFDTARLSIHDASVYMGLKKYSQKALNAQFKEGLTL
jgi:hypothetical protein